MAAVTGKSGVATVRTEEPQVATDTRNDGAAAEHTEKAQLALAKPQASASGAQRWLGAAAAATEHSAQRCDAASAERRDAPDGQYAEWYSIDTERMWSTSIVS